MKILLICILSVLLVSASLSTEEFIKLDLSVGKLRRPYRWDAENGVILRATSASKSHPVSGIVGAGDKKLWMSGLSGTQHITFEFPAARKIAFINIEGPEMKEGSEIKYRIKTSPLGKGKFEYITEKKKLVPGSTRIEINRVVKRLFIDVYPTNGSYFGKVDIFVPKESPPPQGPQPITPTAPATTPATTTPATAPAPTTPAPTTPAPTAPAPTAPAPTTPAPTAPVTPAPVAPTAPTTPAPTAPVTPAPEAPTAPVTTPTTPAPTAPTMPAPTAPTTPAPTTPAPTTPTTPAPTAPTAPVQMEEELEDLSYVLQLGEILEDFDEEEVEIMAAAINADFSEKAQKVDRKSEQPVVVKEETPVQKSAGNKSWIQQNMTLVIVAGSVAGFIGVALVVLAVVVGLAVIKRFNLRDQQFKQKFLEVDTDANI